MEKTIKMRVYDSLCVFLDCIKIYNNFPIFSTVKKVFQIFRQSHVVLQKIKILQEVQKMIWAIIKQEFGIYFRLNHSVWVDWSIYAMEFQKSLSFGL